MPPMPVLPASESLTDVSPNEDAMQWDKEGNASEVEQSLSIGTQLSLGIPCVIAPRNKAGRVARFRAVVKYIGPLMSANGNPVVGVEVALPLPNGVDESAYEFHDGRIKGVKYFSIGTSHHSTDTGPELSHKPEREARRLRLAQMMQGRPYTAAAAAEATVAPPTAGSQSVKRRKDSTGAGLNLATVASRGLFILPSEVLWVVI